ncbi:MAG: type II toxin-antitoxin system VapC family toxin [Roseiflexaceae bacterium]|jgi:tRNA(fMet)-specific endonuclease VapC|nr:type II toxin-antitoxin system VapC family toxin [Chloroflexaceae bacterium]
MAVTTVFIDTNAYVAFKRGHPAAVEIIQHAQYVRLSSIVVGELMAGFFAGTRTALNLQELHQFLAVPRVGIVAIDEHTPLYYARTYQNLREQGRPIPTNDLWIAATVLQHGGVLFSFDHHFHVIDGLVVGDTRRTIGLT